MLKVGRGATAPPFVVMDVIAAANARQAALQPGAANIIRMEAGQPGTGAPAGAVNAAVGPLRSGDPLGYTDAFRQVHPAETGQFTYWDYFRKAFEFNRGARIDHFLLTPDLAARLSASSIDRGPRAQPKPSDHAPVLVELL